MENGENGIPGTGDDKEIKPAGKYAEPDKGEVAEDGGNIQTVDGDNAGSLQVQEKPSDGGGSSISGMEGMETVRRLPAGSTSRGSSGEEQLRRSRRRRKLCQSFGNGKTGMETS